MKLQVYQLKLLMLLISFFLNVSSFSQCPSKEFSNYCSTLLKDNKLIQTFDVNIKSKKDDVERTLYVTFTKRNTYTMYICSGNSDNEMVLTLFDKNDRFIASTYNEDSDEAYNKLSFRCLTTGTYKIAYFFMDKRHKGCGSVVIGLKPPKKV